MRQFLVFLLSLGAVAAEAQRAATADLSRCALITSAPHRLACFDSLAAGVGASQIPARPMTGAGKWQVQQDTNPLDDSKTVTLTLRAETGANRYGESPGLIVRCLSNKTELYINWNDYLGDEAEVTYRVGTGAPATSSWGVSTDHTAAFFPGDAIAFIKGLTGSFRLVTQVTPYNESPITAVFDLEGMAYALLPLQAACGWR